MPLPPVVVDISPAGSEPTLKHALLEACSSIVEEAECVSADVVSPEEEPVAIVFVVWQGEAGVELQVAQRADQARTTRRLSFDPNDDARERWRAAGLVVGTLASLVSKNPTASSAPADPFGPAVSARPTTEPRQSDPRSLGLPTANDAGAPTATARAGESKSWIRLAGLLGSGMDRGAWRAGFELSAVARVVPRLHASAGVEYAETIQPVEDLDARWASVFAGPALVFGERLMGAFRFEAVVQRLSLSTAVDVPGTPTAGSRWLGGARLEASAVYWLTPSVGLSLGAAGKWLFGTTDARVRGEVVATEPPLGYSFGAGANYGF